MLGWSPQGAPWEKKERSQNVRTRWHSWTCAILQTFVPSSKGSSFEISQKFAKFTEFVAIPGVTIWINFFAQVEMRRYPLFRATAQWQHPKLEGYVAIISARHDTIQGEVSRSRRVQLEEYTLSNTRKHSVFWNPPERCVCVCETITCKHIWDVNYLNTFEHYTSTCLMLHVCTIHVIFLIALFVERVRAQHYASLRAKTKKSKIPLRQLLSVSVN